MTAERDCGLAGRPRPDRGAAIPGLTEPEANALHSGMQYAHLSAEDKARFWVDGYLIKRRYFDDEEIGLVRRALVEDATLRANIIDREEAFGTVLDPVDLRGIPWRDADGRTRWAPPAFLPPSDDPGRCLVNLEELPSAVPMVQAALYQLAAARRRSASAPGLPRRPGRAATHDLALGDRHPEVAQMRDDPRYRHLARVILSEHEAPELGAEVADRPRGQSRHHRPTIRGDPAFTAVADHVRTQDQLLDHVGLVSLEPRAGGNGRLKHPLLVDHKPVDLATPAAHLAFRSRRLGGLLHAARFELRRPLEPFQPRNLFA